LNQLKLDSDKSKHIAIELLSNILNAINRRESDLSDNKQKNLKFRKISNTEVLADNVILFICLSSYFKLLELHNRKPELSYLSPDLLFALVDIDLHTAKIEDEEYGFADTEEIFHDLYLELKIQPNKLPQHRIWLTGLMNKEAYFLNPALQSIFDTYEIPIEYGENQIDLDSVYRDIIKELERDPDLRQHFTKAIKRICHCENLNLQNPQLLAESWQKLYDSSEEIQTELILVLLAIAKSKPYWRKIMSKSPARQREALSLQIARRFYAEQNGADGDLYHLPSFFHYLYDIYRN
jgi:hypothetical protein